MTRYYRKIIKIRAEDSPNVILGLAQRAAGRVPSNAILVPGVLTYEEYCRRRKTWDRIRQCIGLDAEFYEGEEVKLFPPLWLNQAATIAQRLRLEGRARRAKAIGIDPGEGIANTSMCAVDEFGIVELVSKQTPDTNAITGEAIAFMRKHNVPSDYVCFDRGGGGKQHADRLRAQGLNVRTVAFGESISIDVRRQLNRPSYRDRREEREERYAFLNRRAQMYFDLRELLDPSVNQNGWGIPAEYVRLQQSLRPIPLLYDQEGRIYLPPKNRKPDAADKSRVKTLIDLIGFSPDEADALVLAVYAMNNKPLHAKAGVN